MRDDLPTPEQILEELADRTAAQVGRLAKVAFDGAWSEMTRYHRFLFAVNASRTPDGKPFSFAEVAGHHWHAPHEEWIRLYVRLFERAIDRMPDDDRFIRALSYAPCRLLPDPDDPQLPAKLLESILDLGPILIHRLEAWITKRTVVEAAAGADAEPRASLAGSDAKAYANVLPEIVGAWERALERIVTPDGRSTGQAKTADARWAALTATWPVVWRHLTNTAHCLAAAVWNEDQAGTDILREALVRWQRTFGADGNTSPSLYLLPDVIGLDWPRAREKAATLGHHFGPASTPDEVFQRIVEGAHRDVLNVSAAVFMLWTIEGKQATAIGARTTRSLLKLEGDDTLLGGSGTRDAGFASRLLGHLRLHMAGDRRQESFAAALDQLVVTLDNLTERRVVPGRVYTPSTSFDRDDLLLSATAILAAATPDADTSGIERSMAGLASRIDLLPEGDQSLRNALDEIRRLQNASREAAPKLSRVLKILEPNGDPDQMLEKLHDLASAALAALGAERLKRLRGLPVDSGKLEHLRVKLEAALLDGSSQISFFSDFTVGRTAAGAPSDRHTFSVKGVAKAGLVEPPMQAPLSNFDEVLASRLQEVAGLHAWAAFTRLPRTKAQMPARVEQTAFWDAIKGLVEDVGPQPVLVVSRHAEARTLRRFMRLQVGNEPGLSVEFRSSRGSYVATINGVDVFAADFPPGVAWLFSGRALKAVRYAAVEGSSSIVTLDYEAVDDEQGKLRMTFAQQTEWTDGAVYEVSVLDPEDEED